MKNTSDTRYPMRRIHIDRPELPGVGWVVSREERTIARNMSAGGDCNIMLLLPPGRGIRR